MTILALEPFYGGSHKAFLDGWKRHSTHEWTVLELPAYKWKWRMRHSAITFAEQVRARVEAGEEWDVLFCSDMLNLTEFKGLVPEAVSKLPSILYFHENQLTYPVQEEKERDLHFAFSNMTSALAADRIWFNSGWHRDTYLEALSAFLKRMPDYAPGGVCESIRRKSSVVYPGIDQIQPTDRKNNIPHLLWCSRWEHDKNPEDFFACLYRLEEMGIEFCVSVLGERFKNMPPVFEEAKEKLNPRIVHWGYQDSYEDYRRALGEADIVISTAGHEFFGIGVVEAVAAGCVPLVPCRLAYPEVLDAEQHPECFYDGSVDDMVEKLLGLLRQRVPFPQQMQKYFWENKVCQMDQFDGLL